MKYLIAVCVGMILLSLAKAGENQHHIYNIVPNDTVINRVIVNEVSRGAATGVSAAQCTYDNGSFDLQVCAAAGYSNGEKAVTFGMGQKYKNFMLNGSVTYEPDYDSEPSFGVGFNWKIK